MYSIDQELLPRAILVSSVISKTANQRLQKKLWKLIT